MSRAILVTGATGKQGGAVVQAILDSPRRNDFTIYALTRTTDSPSAKRLAGKANNVKLIQGDLNDVEEIFKNSPEQFWGVFSVQFAMGQGGAVTEEKQGKALIDAALSHGVQHFVYSSVDRGGAKSIDNATNVPHFISKHNIEKHLISQAERKQGGKSMTYTILRPVAFMDNLTPDFMGKVLPTALRDVLGSTPLQQIAVSDIGKFGAMALLEPESWSGKSLSLAGDELSFAQMQAVFKARTGQQLPTTYGLLVRFILWMSKEFGSMLRWFKTDGYGASVAECKALLPGLLDFETWLETESAWKKSKSV